MWGDDAPETAAATLQSYVSRLRRVLPPAARLVAEAPGYRLAVDPGATDVDRFETALAAGGVALEDAPDVALPLLDAALAEWRGDALAEFADEWWAQAEVARLTELRLHARESRLVALLALGQDERAAGEADALVADHPWRERGWRVLVSALHRAGRQGEALRRAGEYRARLGEELGLEPSPEFTALERAVATDAPPPARAPAPPSSSPGQDDPSPLIGREADEDGVLDLCGRRRLVTLLGPGGIGKTQLALRVAARYRRDTGVRTEVVELARVRADDGVIGAVATQLDVQTQQGRSVLESVLDLLGDRPALLVLDNCEHVLDTIAAVTERLLRVCPHVRVLATSREPLGLPTEAVYKVPALAVGPVDGGGDGRAAPAVALFIRRATDANPDFVADDDTVAAVAELCRRLDGIPLAIELAAARARSLSPAELAERLSDRFGLLAGSRRVSEPRHRSLKDLVDWSYDLLDPTAQRLFARLSAFAGTFDLAAVERVCGFPPVAPDTVAAVLASVVDKSMVQAFAGPRTTYRLLETLREYAGAAATAERDELARRHGDWITEVCERGAVRLHGPDERAGLDAFDAAFDDIRLAVRDAVRAADAGAAFRIVVPAREYAFRRLRYELIGWAESALAVDGADEQPLAAAAWGIVAYGRFVRGENEAAIELGERSRRLAAAAGTDTFGVAERALANAWVFRGDLDRSAAAFDEMLAGALASGDEARITHACYMRSLSLTSTGGADAGMAAAERAASAADRCANPTALAQAAYAKGIWLASAAPDRALIELERSELLAHEVGNTWFELFARTETLWLRAFAGRPLESLRAFADVILAWQRAGDWANQWLSLRHVLGICHLLGLDELAAIVHGALERANAVHAFPFEPAAAARLDNVVDDLRRRLGEERFQAAEHVGRTAATSVVIGLIVAQLRSLAG
jgi:predicted ATPase/DNA-binding SARP family transcriptional activator